MYITINRQNVSKELFYISWNRCHSSHCYFYYSIIFFLYFLNIISREQHLQLIGCCRDFSSDLYVHVCLSLYVREKAIERNNAERKEAEKRGRKEEKGKGGKKEETVSLLSIPKKDILVRGEGRRRNGNNHWIPWDARET